MKEKSNGKAYFEKIDLFMISKNNRAIRAKSKINASERILFVPFNLMITR
jgi:hypothetical protein